VKILVDISPEHYDRILSEFAEESRIYAILKNGLVLHHFEAGYDIRTVEILCDKFHARMILAAAEMYCPEAVGDRRSDQTFSHVTLGRYPWSSLEVGQSIHVPETDERVCR
jgi:hypothetical protein